MTLSEAKYAQDSFDLFGGAANKYNSQFKLNGLEGNVSNFSGVKDWEFSLSYSSEFLNELNGNLYSLSISKRIGKHYFYGRYSPGYQKDFLLSSGTSIIVDTIPVTLKSRYHYEEKFGLGYSFSILKNLNLGFTFRYFLQDFSYDEVRTFSDTTFSINTETISKNYNFWRGDLGISYFPVENLVLNISSINLFTQNTEKDENKDFLLKTEKELTFGITYNPFKSLSASFSIETNRSFLGGFNFGFNTFGGSVGISLQTFHDRYQKPFLAGIIPAINYSTKYFSVTLTGVKYFNDRLQNASFNDFAETGINNLVNNRFSYDRVSISFNFALNTIEERLVKFLDVKIVQDIFPTLSEKYLDNPFAIGKIVNLSDKTVSLKPSSYISVLNKEYVQSPQVFISPNDTAEINFYTIINDPNLLIGKAEVSQAIFLLTTENQKPDDEFRKPILVNDLNSWDGSVLNLKYFVKRDIDFSLNFAKQIMHQYKTVLDTIPSDLTAFYTTSILYEHFAKRMVYVADPLSSVDRVQFPSETIKLKGGDCDDLSVAFASLLKSVGIQTAFVDYKSDSSINHVNLIVNTQIAPENASLLTINDRKYFLRQNDSGKDEIWIPLETTILTGFNEAWQTGSDKFYNEAIDNYGLAKGITQIVDIF